MKNSKTNYWIVIISFILLGIGFYLLKTLVNPTGLMLVLPYVCIGLGCGVFGQGMGNIISHQVMRNNSSIQKQLEIEQKDERNISIACHAKAKAYDMMTFVFGALLISFALMGVDLIPILLFVFTYLFVEFYGIYYRFKYDKVM